MKGKNIILVGTGAVVGFISCGVITIEKLLENDRTRKALKQIIHDKVEFFLFGEASQTGKRSTVSYQHYYDSKKSRQNFYDNLEDVIFSSCKDVEDVLNGMKEIIEQYGFATIADFYDLCGICKVAYKSSKYGWIKIDECEPVRVRDGYKIDLPKPMRIC